LHGVFSIYRSLIRGTALASLAASACASASKRGYLKAAPGLLPASHLHAVLESSSCENPAQFTHYLPKNPETGSVVDAVDYDIPSKERIARVLDMGYVIPGHESYLGLSEAEYKAMGKPACQQPDMYQYDVAVFESDRTKIGRLYAKHTAMERTEQTCKPKYTQVYQPPIKLGGAGRVINLKAGEKCE